MCDSIGTIKVLVFKSIITFVRKLKKTYLPFGNITVKSLYF